MRQIQSVTPGQRISYRCPGLMALFVLICTGRQTPPPGGWPEVGSLHVVHMSIPLQLAYGMQMSRNEARSPGLIRAHLHTVFHRPSLTAARRAGQAGSAASDRRPLSSRRGTAQDRRPWSWHSHRLLESHFDAWICKVFSRPRQSQGLLYEHLCHWLINSFIHWLWHITLHLKK